MPCEERDKLVERFLEAAKKRNDVVRAMNNCEGEVSERLTALAASARQTYHDCRDALEAHERSHGCAPKN